MSLYITTPRLIIREILPSDDKGIFELDTDHEVHKYIGKKPIKTMEEAHGMINFIRQQYTDHGIARWAILDKSNNDFLGWVGFKYMTEPMNDHVHHHDFGYRLIRRAWGKGIATEAASASLNYGIKDLGLRDIYAATDVNNLASRNILEKIGFRFIEVFKYECDPGWRTAEDLSATWYELPEDRYN